MSSAPHDHVIRFLTSLAKAVSAMVLYERSHPAVERAVRTAFEDIITLQTQDPRPVLTFLGDEVVYRDRPIKGLRTWEWGARLAEVGVQRLECQGPVTQRDFDSFVDALFLRVSDPEINHAPPDNLLSIRFGMVGLKNMDQSLSELGEDLAGYTLSEEIATMKWLDEECRGGGKLHMLEADTIVRSLAVAMHSDVELMVPLVHLKGYDQYTTTHSLNISVLSMALGEFLGLPSKYVRRLGVAGLLHDIGKTRVPKELLNKSGKLDPEERAAIEMHPVEGARILIQREANLDLAATVAYEHHIRFDGGGYPKRRFKRRCHPASDLVHLCDVYDALRTHRPYRKAWGQDRVLAYMDEQLGSEFDPGLGRAFLEMMHRWGSRLYRITSQEDAVGIGEADRPDEPPPEALPVEVAAEAQAETAPVAEAAAIATAEAAAVEAAALEAATLPRTLDTRELFEEAAEDLGITDADEQMFAALLDPTEMNFAPGEGATTDDPRMQGRAEPNANHHDSEEPDEEACDGQDLFEEAAADLGITEADEQMFAALLDPTEMNFAPGEGATSDDPRMATRRNAEEDSGTTVQAAVLEPRRETVTIERLSAEILMPRRGAVAPKGMKARGGLSKESPEAEPGMEPSTEAGLYEAPIGTTVPLVNLNLAVEEPCAHAASDDDTTTGWCKREDPQIGPMALVSATLEKKAVAEPGKGPETTSHRRFFNHDEPGSDAPPETDLEDEEEPVATTVAESGPASPKDRSQKRKKRRRLLMK